MSYNQRPRTDASGSRDHLDIQETHPLLDNAREAGDIEESPDPSITSVMGFKALLGRTAFFRHHEERTPLERDLVRRLDIFLMTFGCVSQVIKYLDQTNISSAYVSGMKEDLGLYGNELNYFTTWFSVSYCIMLIPSQVIMTWVRPSWWLPGLEIAWGIVTGLIAICHNAKQIYVLRVFLGLFESSAWPGMMTLFSEWPFPRLDMCVLMKTSVLVHAYRAGQAHGLLPLLPVDRVDDERRPSDGHAQHT